MPDGGSGGSAPETAAALHAERVNAGPSTVAATAGLLPRALFPGALTDIAGLLVGHHTLAGRATGCSVVLCPAGAVCGVDVRGAAPGTRETDLLRPDNLVDKVHAVLLSGGSAFGLEAATGVMRWLAERGHGYAVGPARVPIVPAAVLFDLWFEDGGGCGGVRPDADSGYAACEAAAAAAGAPAGAGATAATGTPVATGSGATAASATADALAGSAQPPLGPQLTAASGALPPSLAQERQGSVGAGAGATVGKLFGIDRAMKGGIGTASLRVGAVTVAALVAVNAIGDVVDPASGAVVAGARTADGTRPLGSVQALLRGELPARALAGMATTIGVVATDAVLTKAQAGRLATMAHDGLARCIQPVHTMTDGDALFALATGGSGRTGDMTVLGVMAAEAIQRAVLNAVRAASGWQQPRVPSARDLGLA